MQANNYAQFYSNAKPIDKYLVGSNSDIYPKDRAGFPVSCFQLAPSSQWPSFFRNKPFSSLSASTISGSQPLDFQLVAAGNTKKIFLDLVVTNTSGSTININPSFCIDHIDFFSTTGSTASQVYGETIYQTLTMLSNYDVSTRLLPYTGIGMTTGWNGVPILTGASAEFVLPIACFIDSCKLRATGLNQPFKFRIWFSALNSGCDTPSAVSVTQCDCWQYGEIWASAIEGYQNNMLKRSVSRWIYQQPVRGLVQATSNMAANTIYQFQLSSLTGLFSSIVFFLQPTPLTYANNRTFTSIANAQLNDSTNSIIGQALTPEILTGIQSLNWPGYVLNNVSGLANIYTMNFNIGNAEMIFDKGCQCGLISMDGRYVLQITTNNTMSTGSYLLSVYGYSYSIVENNMGDLRTYNSA